MSNQCSNPLSQGVKRPASDPLIVGPDGKLLEDVSAYSDVPNKKTRVSNFKRPVCSNGINPNPAPTSVHNGFGGNLNPGSRSDKDGLSPHFHQNRIADRLSPIGVVNGPSFSNGLAHPMTNHRSPHNVIGEQVPSPPYYNNSNQLSPPGTLLQAGEGEYSPYSWNSKNLNGGSANPHDSQGYLDTNKSRGMDSDETDSIDSGNGSSGGSASGRNNAIEDAGYNNGVNNNHKGSSVNSKSVTNRGTELSVSQSANSVTNPICRVSSTTKGSGSGYHTTPQSSPESHLESLQIVQQQKGGCDGKVKQANNAAAPSAPVVRSSSGGGNSIVANGHARTVSKDREREKEPRSDRERTGRDRESRGRDRERSDKRSHRERKSAHVGVVPMEISRDGQNGNEDGDNTEHFKPTPQYPPYLT